jgi:acyl CoA:acetate/3-ketoacid CoA transferase beta subunit
VSDVTLDEVCVTAIAEAFRGDGEILCNPIGIVPVCGGRLARESFEPDLMMTDTVSVLVANTIPVGAVNPERVIEGNIPFRSIFDVVWSGRRHVVMGASQIDRFGNTNIANIGPWARPTAQLLGVRGAPGNTVNHAVSFWIPKHTPQVFVTHVDMVSGLGYDRAAALGEWVAAHHRLPRVVTNLAVLDFETADHSMRLVSTHPGVSVDDVVAATGFELMIAPDIAESRGPTPDESAAIDRIDPAGLRHREVPA